VLIRPGTLLLIESGEGTSLCTAGFVFDDKRRISTAGHCAKPGDAAIALALPTILVPFGLTSTSMDGGLGNDWALIDIDPEWREFTDPTVALVSGPCGTVRDPSGPLVKHVGHGLGVGTGGTARVGLFGGLDPDAAFSAVGLAYSGDSGAPVLEVTQTHAGACSAGGAIGLLTHIEAIEVGGIEEVAVPTGSFFGTPTDRITREGHQLDDAEPLP
jgi:hypothetical protein